MGGEYIIKTRDGLKSNASIDSFFNNKGVGLKKEVKNNAIFRHYIFDIDVELNNSVL